MSGLGRTLYVTTVAYDLLCDDFPIAAYIVDTEKAVAENHPDYILHPTESYRNDDGSITYTIAGEKIRPIKE